jgi:hypothetical protein
MQSSAKFTSPFPAASPNSPSPDSPFPTPHSSPPRRRGRPRRLNETELCEICAYVSGGLGLEEAAEYVRCSVNTIRREANRNPEFEKDLHDAMLRAQLHPLRAMQKAVATHWRAAAWMLERMFPERFGRPDPGSFGAREARELLAEILSIFRAELEDHLIPRPDIYSKIEKRIEAAFEYFTHLATNHRRSRRGLRHSMQLMDLKKRQVNRVFVGDTPVPTADELLESFSLNFPSTPPRPAKPAKPPVVSPVEPSAKTEAKPVVANNSEPPVVSAVEPPSASPANPHSPQRPPQNPPAEVAHNDRPAFRELFGILSDDLIGLPPDASKTPDSAPPKTQ